MCKAKWAGPKASPAIRIRVPSVEAAAAVLDGLVGLR